MIYITEKELQDLWLDMQIPVNRVMYQNVQIWPEDDEFSSYWNDFAYWDDNSYWRD